MQKTDVLVVGGSQAGLSMSYHLSQLGVDHLVLERDQPGTRWVNERWKTLRLLTPLWQSRLLGFDSLHQNPHAFLSAGDFAQDLIRYADHITAPLCRGVEVQRLEKSSEGFLVYTNQDTFFARNVVVATGQCATPLFPNVGSPSSEIHVLHSRNYRGADALPPGGVLVVGASATGVQLAQEIRDSGRDVLLSTGPHARMPRRYRGRDIMAWLEISGIARDPKNHPAQEHMPSLQLIGSDDQRDIHLKSLAQSGVRIVGSLAGLSGPQATFRDDLWGHLEDSHRRMLRTLDRVDATITAMGWQHHVEPAFRPTAFALPPYEPTQDLRRAGIQTVLFATGYQSHMPFLPAWACDRRGEPLCTEGQGVLPGLYFLGLHFMRQRYSSTIAGVQRDAAHLSQQIDHRLERSYRHAS